MDVFCPSMRTEWLNAGRRQDQLLLIISDSCYSGQWIIKARAAHVQAADEEKAMCSIGLIVSCEADERCGEGDGGGDFTSRYFSVDRALLADLKTIDYQAHSAQQTAAVMHAMSSMPFFRPSSSNHHPSTMTYEQYEKKVIELQERWQRHENITQEQRHILAYELQVGIGFSVHSFGGFPPYSNPYHPRYSRCNEALLVADHRDVVWGYDFWYQCVDPRESLSSYLTGRAYFDHSV